ncbi:hypothetical protein ACRTDU_14375 [Sunxiuqinia elliptica]
MTKFNFGLFLNSFYLTAQGGTYEVPPPTSNLTQVSPEVTAVGYQLTRPRFRLTAVSSGQTPVVPKGTVVDKKMKGVTQKQPVVGTNLTRVGSVLT